MSKISASRVATLIRKFSMTGTRTPILPCHYAKITAHGGIILIGETGGVASINIPSLGLVGERFVSIPAITTSISAGVGDITPTAKNVEIMPQWEGINAAVTKLAEAGSYSVTLPLSAVQALLPAMGDRDIRYYLNGMYLDRPRRCIVATNGHMLLRHDAVDAMPVSDLPGVIIHAANIALAAGIAELVKAPSIRIDVVEGEKGKPATYVLWAGDSCAVFSTAIEGVYPDYPRLIVKARTQPARPIKPKAWVDALPDVRKALRIASASDDAPSNTKAIRLNLNESTMAAVLTGGDSKPISVANPHTGKLFPRPSVDVDYLQAALEGAAGYEGDAYLSCETAEGIIGLWVDVTRFVALVMPMRL
jgi:hypothetical protein